MIGGSSTSVGVSSPREGDFCRHGDASPPMEARGKPMTDLHLETIQRVTRRQLFGSAGTGIGAVALASLLHRDGTAAVASPAPLGTPGLPGLPHHPPTAKRVVMLWQGGGPSHVDLFDPKPTLISRGGEDIPASVRGGTLRCGGSWGFPHPKQR
jgi:hypothetical protein